MRALTTRSTRLRQRLRRGRQFPQTPSQLLQPGEEEKVSDRDRRFDRGMRVVIDQLEIFELEVVDVFDRRI